MVAMKKAFVQHLPIEAKKYVSKMIELSNINKKRLIVLSSAI